MSRRGTHEGHHGARVGPLPLLPHIRLVHPQRNERYRQSGRHRRRDGRHEGPVPHWLVAQRRSGVLRGYFRNRLVQPGGDVRSSKGWEKRNAPSPSMTVHVPSEHSSTAVMRFSSAQMHSKSVGSHFESSRPSVRQSVYGGISSVWLSPSFAPAASVSRSRPTAHLGISCARVKPARPATVKTAHDVALMVTALGCWTGRFLETACSDPREG